LTCRDSNASLSPSNWIADLQWQTHKGNSRPMVVRIVKLLILGLIMLSVSPAFAFDNKRQGFILGFGAGFHTIDYDFIYNGSNIGSESKSGVATSFKIGAGLTDQFALYYVRNASWYSAPYFDGFTIKDITYTTGIMGLGAAYFLSPSAPSAYVLGAIGTGDLSAPFESGVSSDTGSAIMLGAGYELSSHFMVEGTWQSTDIDSADDPLLSIESSSFQVTINYVFY